MRLEILGFLETCIPPGMAWLGVQLLTRILVCESSVRALGRDLLSYYWRLHERGLACSLDAGLSQTLS